MKFLTLLILLSLVACEDDTGPKTQIVFISAHEASDSYYLHLQKGESVSYRSISYGDFDGLKGDFTAYLLNDSHDNFTEEALRAEISNPAHTLYKCATPYQLSISENAGQQGEVTFRGVECWRGEWF